MVNNKQQARKKYLHNLVGFVICMLLLNGGLYPYIWHRGVYEAAIGGWITSTLVSVLYVMHFVACWRSWDKP